MIEKLNRITERKKKALNIIGVFLLVAINTLINFLLTPFITENLGVEANGYITLANNFITFFALVSAAFNSMAGRFILVAHYQNDSTAARGYYSSVYFGNIVIAIVLAVPACAIVFFLPSIISIEGISDYDAQSLFAIVFANFFVGLIFPQWDCATYVTNTLYLRSLKNAFVSLVRALTIMLLFWLFLPHVQFVALGGLVSALIGLAIAFGFKSLLLPCLRVELSGFSYSKARELVSSGIWNSVSQCGNLLLEGLDLLIANIFISAVASGILSVAKILPNMVNQIIGNIVTTFGPSITRLFAEGDYDGIVDETRNNMKIIAVLSSLPTGIAIAFGDDFFSLWVPSQDAELLTQIMALTLVGVFISGIAKCTVNIFGALNHLKTNSLVVIVSGLFNTMIVLAMLSFTDLGLFAIAGVCSIVTLTRELGFTAPYSARLLGKPWYTFYAPMFKGVACLFVCAVASNLIAGAFSANNWLSLIIAMFASAAVSLALELALLLNKRERETLLKIINLRR